jgi:hypothetical protein
VEVDGVVGRPQLRMAPFPLSHSPVRYSFLSFALRWASSSLRLASSFRR